MGPGVGVGRPFFPLLFFIEVAWSPAEGHPMVSFDGGRPDASVSMGSVMTASVHKDHIPKNAMDSMARRRCIRGLVGVVQGGAWLG